MKHRRSPTHSYPHARSPHAALALRHPCPSIPTLLSPLRSIANTSLLARDALDDFQSNAWINAPSHRPPLSGLGITCFRNAPTLDLQDQPLSPDDPALRMQIDRDGEPFSLPIEVSSEDLSAMAISCCFESGQNCRFVPSLSEEPLMALGFDGDILPAANDVVGLIPDINMYDVLRRLDLAHPGIDPLDTIYSTSLHSTRTSYGEPASPAPKDHHTDHILPTSDSRAEQSPSPRVIRDIMSILVQPAPEFSFLSPSANSPNAQKILPSQLSATRPLMSTEFETNNVLDSEHCALPDPCNEYANTTRLSPVLNAHLGIELSDLMSRAERFRNKYPQRDIDREWLSHFAGKLSDRGELLNDFRCYVIGCDQRNRRRDHILVHVGAHIGQRPFACSVCPLRFLRKNECKRHEASHSGFRPYSCDICGQSFVRQDLVKRHVKRTHGVRDENQSGLTRPSRKKPRLA